jgi:hypothetical protein
MPPMKIVHIAGIIGGFAASLIAIVVGLLWATSKAADPMPPGQVLCFGVAALASTSIAVADGARATPQLGIWKVGGKFQGLGDLATLLILVIMGAGIGIGLLFR